MYGPYRVIRNAPFPLRRFDSGNTLNISKDGAAFGAATATPTETPAASGVWYNILTVAEMSADHIAYKGAAGDSRSDGFLIPEPARDSGVAQAGSTSTITLRAAAPAVNLAGTLVEIVRGTGKDQQPRLITAYDTTSKVATVSPDFSTQPDSTSEYIVTSIDKVNTMMIDSSHYPAAAINEFWSQFYKTGTVGTGSTASFIKTDIIGRGVDELLGMALGCLSSTNNGVMRPIIGYDTLTGDITVDPPFSTAPIAGDRVAYFGTTG